MYKNHSSFWINFCCYSLSSCAPACWLFCYLLRGFLVPHVCLSSWQPLFVFHGPRSLNEYSTVLHSSHVRLFSFSLGCHVFPFFPNAISPCSLETLGHNSLLDILAIMQHKQHGNTLHDRRGHRFSARRWCNWIVNVQCKILYLGFREFWGKYPPHVFLVSHFKYLGYLGFSV